MSPTPTPPSAAREAGTGDLLGTCQLEGVRHHQSAGCVEFVAQVGTCRDEAVPHRQSAGCREFRALATLSPEVPR